MPFALPSRFQPVSRRRGPRTVCSSMGAMSSCAGPGALQRRPAICCRGQGRTDPTERQVLRERSASLTLAVDPGVDLVEVEVEVATNLASREATFTQRLDSPLGYTEK